MTNSHSSDKKIRFILEEPTKFKRQEADLKQFLTQGLETLKIRLEVERQQKLIEYIKLMIKWNRAYNLTSVREPTEIMIRHIFDSLAAGFHLQGDNIIDVGSGAGLPGIPLALTYPEKQFTLIDSNGKKIRFLFHLQQALKLPNVTIINSRVEGYQKSNLLNEVTQFKKYSTIISRAFSSLRDMLYNTEHLCHLDGIFLAMKGVYPLTELHEVPSGFKLLDVTKLEVPFLDAERHLVKIVFE